MLDLTAVEWGMLADLVSGEDVRACVQHGEPVMAHVADDYAALMRRRELALREIRGGELSDDTVSWCVVLVGRLARAGDERAEALKRKLVLAFGGGRG